MKTALLLVDVQRNMLEGDEPVPSSASVRPALQSLLERARAEGAPVVHIQNDGPEGSPDEPFSAGWHLVFPAEGDELVVRKDKPDTFAANPSLAAELSDRGVTTVVVAGMQSNYCVAATSRAAREHGFTVVLASGAHATYDEDDSADAISAAVEAELAAGGVTVRPSDAVSFS